MELNAAQMEAVLHGEGPCLVIAGAGSGKTRVLTERIQRLVAEGVAPWRILGFTFTNKAAGEMRERLQAGLGTVAERLWLGTFHATGLRILRREWERAGIARDFSIYDSEDQLTLLKRVIKDLALPDGTLTPQAARSLIERYKGALVDPEIAAARAEGFREAQVARVYQAYQRSLRAAHALDFTDLIALPVRLFSEDENLKEAWAGRFDFVLVDEFQDTNPLQMRFVELLASSCGNLFAVGDDDQSIYGWRGADVRHILDFEERFAGTHLIRLEQNYRSTQAILEVANAVIAHNLKRKGKELWTDRSGGQKVRVVTVMDEDEEAEAIARRVQTAIALDQDWGRHAVLYRTHAQSRALEGAFGRRRIPYQIVGGTRFYDRKEIRDLLAYLKLAANPTDSVSLQRILNTPPRGIGKTTVSRLEDLAARVGLAPGLLLTAYSEHLSELPEAGAKRLREFGRLILSLSPHPDQDPAAAVIERLLEKVAFIDHLRQSDPIQGETRVENVAELVSAAQAFYEAKLTAAAQPTEEAEERPGRPGSLLDFLADVALVADVDGMDSQGGAVTLMTLHNAKGLEFDAVYLAGVEEQLLPHAMSVGDEAELEEERRLFYVGVTRARSRLTILHAMNRRRFGDTLSCQPSRFLEELPEAWIDREGEQLLATAGLPRGEPSWSARGSGDWRSATGAARSGWRRTAGGGAGSRGIDARRPPGVAGYGQDEFNQDIVRDSGQDGDDFAGEINQEESALRVGMRVKHPTLGVGKIHKLEGGGDNLRVIILFEKRGARKLLARAAGLVPL